MRQEDGGRSSLFAWLRAWDQWRSPFWLHYGGYIAVAAVLFLLLLSVGVSATTALIVGVVVGAIAASVMDWLWGRHR
jgi:hypothetical protein